MKLIYSIHKYDVFMFTWLVNARLHALMSKLGRYLSKTGDGHLYVAAAVYLLWLDGIQNLLLQAIALAFLIERPLYFVLKNGFRRDRPQAALQNFRSVITPSDKFSFPSGHTSAAFMMATLTGYFFPFLMIPLFAWAALVGFSRVVLGVHFPTDTLMGLVLGIGSALLSLKIIIA
ncbi:MAG: phosphatase PAP2 family protein [Gammaproteobacteria bacterium]